MRIDRMGNMRYLWHKQFADKDSFSKLKSLEIRNCEKLSVVFPSNAYRQFERFESLHVSECNAIKVIYEYQAFSFENLSCDSSIEKKNSFQRLAFLNIERCDSLRDVLPFSKCLPHFQGIEVKWCSNMEAIVGEGNEGELIELTQLTSLMLRYLPNFRVISRTSGMVSFPNLTSLNIYKCDSLKYVFTTSMVKSLQQLKVLDISWCESMEAIIDDRNEDEVMELTQLTSLTLWFLPNLRGICRTSGMVSSLKAIQNDDPLLWKLEQVTLFDLIEESVPFMFDFLRRIYSLEKLTFKGGYLGEILSIRPDHLRLKHMALDGVSKLKHIVKEDSQLNPIFQRFHSLAVGGCNDMVNIAPSSSSFSFTNLTTLRIFRCEKMTSLVTASTAKSMIHLMELRVSYCKMMEDIIVANEDGDCTEEHDDDVITFNKLKILTLKELPILNRFCSGSYNINFPLLEQVSIEGCNQMKNFCGGEVSTPNLSYNRLADMSEDGDDYSEMLTQLFGPEDMQEDGDNSSGM